MTLQAIRRFYEEPVEAVAAANTIPFRYENQLESGGDASDEFMTLRLNYGNMVDPTLCGPIEVIRGSLVVEYFGPKGIGTARAQEVMTAAAKALCTRGEAGVASVAGYKVYGSVLGINGPFFTPLNDRPYLFSSFSCPITARLGDPVVP